MRGYSNSGLAQARKVVDIPPAGAPNGMTLLSKKDGTILISDSKYGIIYRVNIYTGAYEVVLDDPALKPVQGATVMFGVNGIHVIDSVLYFANTNQGLLSSNLISSDGYQAGKIVNITDDIINADGFAVDEFGAIWVCRNTSNEPVRVTPDGQITSIAGGTNSTKLVGPVAAKFGRGCDDRDTLYIATDGLTFSAQGAILTNNDKFPLSNPKV